MKKTIFFAFLTITSVYMFVLRLYKKTIVKLRDENNKKQEFYNVFCNWLKIHNSEENLSEYFIKHNYKNVAIYGMKEMGELLYEELRRCKDVNVICVIDRNTSIEYNDICILSPDENIPDIDVMVVTAIHYYNEIEDLMHERVTCPIISIEDVVYDI